MIRHIAFDQVATTLLHALDEQQLKELLESLELGAADLERAIDDGEVLDLKETMDIVNDLSRLSTAIRLKMIAVPH